MSVAISVNEDLIVPQRVTLNFKPLLRKLNDDDFFEFCQANREMRIERSKEGDVIIC